MKLKYTSIGRNILIIDKYMKLYLKNALKPYQLNTAEGMVLLVLYGHDRKTQDEILNELHQEPAGITQDRIIDELHYDKGVMTRTMQSLESKGYVEREENANDGRSYVFCLTNKAKDFKPDLISVLRYWSDGVIKGFDEKTVEIIDDALFRLAENSKVIGKTKK